MHRLEKELKGEQRKQLICWRTREENRPSVPEERPDWRQELPSWLLIEGPPAREGRAGFWCPLRGNHSRFLLTHFICINFPGFLFVGYPGREKIFKWPGWRGQVTEEAEQLSARDLQQGNWLYHACLLRDTSGESVSMCKDSVCLQHGIKIPNNWLLFKKPIWYMGKNGCACKTLLYCYTLREKSQISCLLHYYYFFFFLLQGRRQECGKW